MPKTPAIAVSAESAEACRAIPSDRNRSNVGEKTEGDRLAVTRRQEVLGYALKEARLPTKWKNISHTVGHLRRALNASVMEQKGEVSLTDAAHIQTAVRWERHTAVTLSTLREFADRMSPAQVVGFSEKAAEASSKRDKSISALRLDARTEDDFKAKWLKGQIVEAME